ncbi:MAG: hypothetical protein ABIP63_08005 [Thermoanaerobaculia bacterium]
MRALAALSILMLSMPALAGDDDVTHRFASAVSRGTTQRVVVEIPAGRITIRNGSTSEISVKGEVRRSFDGHHEKVRAQRVADDVSAEIIVQGKEAIVRPRFGPNAQSWSARSFHSGMEIQIEVPPGMDVLLTTRFGEIDAEGTFGSIDADLTAGEIHVRTPHAAAREVNASVRIGEVHANTGEELIEKEGLFPRAMHYVNTGGKRDINLHTTFGEVHVTLTR